MWGMNDQNKIMFGQHPAQNRNVILGISKVRDVDPEQQKHWDNGFGSVSTQVNCSCCDYQQEEHAADQ